MADFGVGNFGKQIAPQGIRFERVPILGNAGKKIDEIVDFVISPAVNDPKVPKPAEKKILETIGIAPTIEAKALIDFFLGAGSRVNPPSSELRKIKISPFGILTPEQLAALQQQAATLHITPTWRADP